MQAPPGSGLVSPVLGVAERREIGVVAGPVQSLAERGDQAGHEQGEADAVNLGQHRKL
jgi:hypothetical protein